MERGIGYVRQSFFVPLTVMETVFSNWEPFDSDGKSMGVVFQTASPFDTHRRMTELVDCTRAASCDAHCDKPDNP